MIHVATCVLLTLWALSSIAISALMFCSWPEYTASMEADPDTAGRPYARLLGVFLAIVAAPVALPICFVRGARKARAEAEAESTRLDEWIERKRDELRATQPPRPAPSGSPPSD